MEGAVNNEVEDLKENGTSIWSNKVFRIFLSKLYFFDRQFNGYTRFTAMGNEINKFTLTCFGGKHCYCNGGDFVCTCNRNVSRSNVEKKAYDNCGCDEMYRYDFNCSYSIFNKMLYIPLLILLIIRSIGSALFTPASNAALVTYVEEKHVQQAISLRQVSIQIISVAIPLLASFLISIFSFHGVFVLDAITFLYHF